MSNAVIAGHNALVQAASASVASTTFYGTSLQELVSALEQAKAEDVRQAARISELVACVDQRDKVIAELHATVRALAAADVLAEKDPFP